MIDFSLGVVHLCAFLVQTSLKKNPKNQGWGCGMVRKPRYKIYIFLKKTPVMPAHEHGHMGRKGISYSPKRRIKASGGRLTPAKSLALSRTLQLKSMQISA